MLQLILSLTVCLVVGCGKQSGIIPSDETPATAPVVAQCTVIDKCTYIQQGFTKVAEYECSETKWEADTTYTPPIDPDDFEGAPCIITREDFHPSTCQLPNGMGSYPCSIQGPGPVANP